MKSPIQKLVKLESDLTNMLDSDKRVAMALLEYIRSNRKDMLEEEKAAMCLFQDKAHRTDFWVKYNDAEECFDDTFNNK